MDNAKCGVIIFSIGFCTLACLSAFGHCHAEKVCHSSMIEGICLMKYSTKRFYEKEIPKSFDASTIFLMWYYVKWNSKICANFDAFSLMEHFIKHIPLTSEECFLWTQISPQILWNYHLGLASWNSAPCYLYKYLLCTEMNYCFISKKVLT